MKGNSALEEETECLLSLCHPPHEDTVSGLTAASQKAGTHQMLVLLALLPWTSSI